MTRDPLVVQKISLIKIVSTCSAAASCGCRSSGVFYAVDSAALQGAHRCTHAPCGTLAAPAVLPTLTKQMKKQHEHCMQCFTAFDEVHLCKHDVSLQKQFTLVAFASVSTQHASNKTTQAS